MIPEPNQPEYFLDSFPRDDFPRYVWTDKPTTLPADAPLEDVLLHLIGMGYFADAKPDFTALNALVDLYDATDQPVPPKYPLYGRDAHRTRAGVHADGLNKFWDFFQKTRSIAHP